MGKWILVMWIYSGNGISFDNIPDFETKSACEQAFVLIEKEYSHRVIRPKLEHVCIEQ